VTLSSGRRQGVLGIDLGTSSVKAVVTDPGGAVIGQASRPYTVLHPQAGWSEIDPNEWLAATIVAVRHAVDSCAHPAIIAIGLSGQMHGLVATNDAGAAVREAMLWSDARAMPQLELYAQLPPAVHARLANPLTAGMAGPMLAWLRTEEPATYRQTRWALQPKDWLRAQLTGQYWTEPSDASATLLYDLSTDYWDPDVVRALGIDPDLLPDLLPYAAHPAGTLTPEGANLLGLAEGTIVAAGAGDTAAAALGSGLHEANTAQVTIGSGAQIIIPVPSLDDRSMPDRPATHLYRSATRHGWYAMAAMVNAGTSLDWVRQTLNASWAEVYRAATAVPAPDDPIFLPHLSGERTPHLDPVMRASWTGLAPHHSRQHLLHAALEGLALSIRDGLHALPAGDTVKHLRLAGGGTTDPAWRQMLADVLDVPLHIADVSSASSRGAALLAAQAADLTTEADIFARHHTTAGPVITPRPGRSDYYLQRYDRYLHRLHALRAT